MFLIVYALLAVEHALQAGLPRQRHPRSTGEGHGPRRVGRRRRAAAGLAVRRGRAWTLVVRGAESPLFKAEYAERMTKINPMIRLVTIPDARREGLDAVVEACRRADISCRFVRREMDIDPAAVLGAAVE
jgi:hypothetical protein